MVITVSHLGRDMFLNIFVVWGVDALLRVDHVWCHVRSSTLPNYMVRGRSSEVPSYIAQTHFFLSCVVAHVGSEIE